MKSPLNLARRWLCPRPGEEKPPPAPPPRCRPDEVADALILLHTVKIRAANARREVDDKFCGLGKYEAAVLSKYRADMMRAHRAIADYREVAPLNGVDAEATIAAFGGVPENVGSVLAWQTARENQKDNHGRGN